MEVRNRVGKYHEGSPERKKVWTERSPRYQQCRKVPVVYYLCRNHRLEHPHFMEVPLSSPDGLYLRDVIERLNVLRGRGMAYMYSWSCKRSYKTGFVWYDLCEGDSVIPAHGNEYVLKGSELFEESDPGHFSPIGNAKTQHLKPLPEPVSSRRMDDSSSSSSLNGKEDNHNPEDNTSSPLRCHASSCVSPDYRAGKNSSWVGTLSLTELKINKKGGGAADASTQTDEKDTECVSCVEPEVSKENSEIKADFSVSSAMSDTLETLIRADARKMKSSRIYEEEGLQMSSKLKATKLLMQLISCGSMSVKDGGFGMIPGYSKPAKASPSPLFSTSVLFGECNCLSPKSSFRSQKLEDKEYFSGSAIETGTLKDKTECPAALKRSSSFNATDWELREEESNSGGGSNCIPRSIKASLSKHPKSESMRYSPVSSRPRNSTEGTRLVLSNGVSDPSASSSARMDMDSFREEDENLIRIEES